MVNFLNHVETLYKTINTDNVELWCLGDININSLSEKEAATICINDLCKFYGLHLLINQCTRPYKQCVACLDNIMTMYDNNMTTGVLNLLVSNHLPVYCVKTMQPSVGTEKTIHTRSYKNFDEELFLDWLAEADWDAYYGLKDPSEAWNFIQNHIVSFLDSTCPKLTKVVRDMGNKWMNSDIHSLIWEREQNVELFLSTNNEVYLNRARKLR